MKDNNMKNRHLHRFSMTVLGAALLVIAGCVGGTSKPATFYLLQALPESEALMQTPHRIRLEVGPIAVPAYLDRAQIASVGDDHRLTVDQFNRWAEPLKDSFSRVLAENLAILLETPDVYRYPQRRAMLIDYQIELTVTRFFTDAEGTAILVAYWSLVGDSGKTVVSRKRSFISQPADADTFEAIVAAQNWTLQELSREIATEIQRLGQQGNDERLP
jgi:uncharacterized lipoprotein YmbA